MKGKDAECRRVFQSFKKGKEGTKALRNLVTKVSEFQSAKVFIKAKNALRKKSFIVFAGFSLLQKECFFIMILIQLGGFQTQHSLVPIGSLITLKESWEKT